MLIFHPAGLVLKVKKHGICHYMHNEVTRVAFLPDGKRLLSLAWDGSAYLWNLPN
jgi:WD40 repeat protein